MTKKLNMIIFLARLIYPARRAIAAMARHTVARKKLRLIFVAGMSRSGTTVLSKFLALDSNTALYVHEPIKPLLTLQFTKKHGEAEPTAFWNFVFKEEQNDWKVHLLMCIVLYYAWKVSRNLKTLCIKPIALVDVVEEVFKASGASIVFICRHPCGRSESILRQRRIHAGQYVDGLEGLTQLGNEWGKTHAVVQEKFRNHPEWIWVRFEDLCHKPSKEVMELYGKLGLEWTPEIERAVREMTTTESEDFYGTNRNSENQIDKWHDALTSEQIEAIQQGCAPHGTGLYKGF